MLYGRELRRPRRRGPWAAVLAGAGDVRAAEEGEALRAVVLPLLPLQAVLLEDEQRLLPMLLAAAGTGTYKAEFCCHQRRQAGLLERAAAVAGLRGRSRQARGRIATGAAPGALGAAVDGPRRRRSDFGV